MALILDGKILSLEISNELTTEISTLKTSPKLAIVMDSNNPASEVYVRNKLLYAKKINLETNLIRLPSNSSKNSILSLINKLNDTPSINGIIVQSPLQHDEYQEDVFETIDPIKDVDGFSSKSIGMLCNGNSNCFISCTPLGILTLLVKYGIELKGKHVVIIGRSKIVGRPLSILLSQRFDNCNATVTVCHSLSDNLKEVTRSADILISAIGKAKFIDRTMVKKNVVIVDVGINKIEDISMKNGYRLCGDVDFESAQDVCRAITPVPGGVGPMTIAMLMKNTLKAYRLQNQ